MGPKLGGTEDFPEFETKAWDVNHVIEISRYLTLQLLEIKVLQSIQHWDLVGGDPTLAFFVTKNVQLVFRHVCRASWSANIFFYQSKNILVLYF